MKMLIFRNAFTSFVKAKSVFIPQIVILVAFIIMCAMTGVEANSPMTCLYLYICDISLLVLSIASINILFVSQIFIENRSAGIFELELRSGYSKQAIYFSRLLLNVILTTAIGFIGIILFAILAIPTSHMNTKVTNVYAYGFFSIFAFDLLIKGLSLAFVAVKKPSTLISVATILSTIAILNPCLAMGTQLEPERSIEGGTAILNFAIQSSNLVKENENGILASIFNSLKQSTPPDSWKGDDGVLYLNPGDVDDTGTLNGATHGTTSLFNLYQSLGFSSELLEKMYTQDKDFRDLVFDWSIDINNTPEKENYVFSFNGNSFEVTLGDEAKQFYDSSLKVESNQDYSDYWANNLYFTGVTNDKINLQSEISNMKKTLNGIKVSESLSGEWSSIKELLINLYESKVIYAYNKGSYISTWTNEDFIVSRFGNGMLPLNESGENGWKLPISLLDTFKNINPYMLQIRAMINWLGSINITNSSVELLSWLHDDQNNEDLYPFNSLFYNSYYEMLFRGTNYNSTDAPTINDALADQFNQYNKVVKKQYKIPFNIYTSLLFNMGLNKTLNSYYDDETISRDKSLWDYKDVKIVTDNDDATEYDDVKYIKEVSVGGLAYNVALAMVAPMIIGIVLGAIGYIIINKKIIL